MGDFYTTREAVKRSVGISGADRDGVLDDFIEAVSRWIDQDHNRPAGDYIPTTETRSYDWPQGDFRRRWRLHLDRDLLSVSALTDEGDDVTAISSDDFFLEPSTLGPPYFWIDIDLSSTADFSTKDTHQRQIRPTGSWGYGNDTKAAGAIGPEFASSTTATVCLCSDASLIGVGDTLLVESEQLFVSGRAWVDQGTNLNDTLTASVTDTTITYNSTPVPKAGETILIDSEEMLIVSISGSDLNVKREYNGTTLATHSNGAGISLNRTLTVVRGTNGTTAANHADTTALTKYQPPLDIQMLCKAKVISAYEQERGGWMGTVGSGEGAINVRQHALTTMEDKARAKYRRRVVVAV